MKISHQQEKEIDILSPKGRLDAQNASFFKKEVLTFLKQDPPLLVLDLSGLEFIDSAGLGAFIGILRKMESREGRLILTQLNPEVESIFEITRLHKLFSILPTLKEALESFRK